MDEQKSGMTAYVNSLQEKSFLLWIEDTLSSHQQEVAGYFDAVTTAIQGGSSSVTALAGSTEEEQFSLSHNLSRRYPISLGARVDMLNA